MATGSEDQVGRRATLAAGAALLASGVLATTAATPACRPERPAPRQAHTVTSAPILAMKEQHRATVGLWARKLAD
ncbi:hypothetical protein [Streptomyces sp. 2131.1]|uniref:hypothetical protein n=1 Tax=Streptomyces sp. 2131.1 TaxID=1855346 RepID=UPI000B8A3CD4|nr:hypothetical protein [Streptomyces sp. 2131.1]